MLVKTDFNYNCYQYAHIAQDTPKCKIILNNKIIYLLYTVVHNLQSPITPIAIAKSLDTNN